MELQNQRGFLLAHRPTIAFTLSSIRIHTRSLCTYFRPVLDTSLISNAQQVYKFSFNTLEELKSNENTMGAILGTLDGRKAQKQNKMERSNPANLQAGTRSDFTAHVFDELMRDVLLYKIWIPST